MSWYSFYKFAGFRNPNDLLAMKISRDIFTVVKDNIGKDTDRVFKVDKNCSLFVRILYLGENDIYGEINSSNLKYNTFTIKADTNTSKNSLYNPFVRIGIFLNHQFSESDFESINYAIFDAIRHELEHYQQYKNKFNDEYFSPVIYKDFIPMCNEYREYLLSTSEIEPYLKGLVFAAKKQKIPFDTILDQSLNGIFFNNNNALRDKILASNMGQEVEKIITDIRSKIIQRAKEIYPKLRLT